LRDRAGDAEKMVKYLQELVHAYQEIENRFPLAESDGKYSSLVTANGSWRYPIQRWFHLKEGFSVDLLEALLGEWSIPVESVHRVLDPFCGVGTTLLACHRIAKKYPGHHLEALGLERNPFLQFVSETKLRWHEYDTDTVRSQAASLLDGAAIATGNRIPSLSTLHRKDVYDPKDLRHLLGVRQAIRHQLYGQSEKDSLLLGYASALEAVSGVRKDGRALRIVPDKQRLAVSAALASAWDMIVEDLSVAAEYFQPIEARALLGDGRTLAVDSTPSYETGQFDLILYSPPYLNNIDYTEVYKIELWMCGFVSTADEFRELRYKTFRSHPSVRFPDPITMNEDIRMQEVEGALDVLIRALPKDQNLAWRTGLFRGYFDDMYISLKHQLEALVPGGWIFCVVGNSLHGPRDNPRTRVPVASDLLVALIAESLGLEVKAIQVARYLRRRSPNSRYLRESILVMQKRC